MLLRRTLVRAARAPVLSARAVAPRALLQPTCTLPTSLRVRQEHTPAADDDEHLQLLGLRMDSLKRRKISEQELREAFSNAVVGGAGRCTDFSALQNAFNSLSATVRSMVPRGVTGDVIASARVEVTRGTYAGKHGTVVRRTPARVVVRLADGGEVCLNRNSLAYLAADEVFRPETRRSAVDDGHCPSWAH